ncbi:hypothetical protein A4A49_56291, partial [Nicotiana attenuata]
MTGPTGNNQLGLENVTSIINHPEASEVRNNTCHDAYIARLEQQIADLQEEVERARSLTTLSRTLDAILLPEPRNTVPIPSQFSSLSLPIPDHSQPHNIQPKNMPASNPQYATLPTSKQNSLPITNQYPQYVTAPLHHQNTPTRNHPITQYISFAHVASPNEQCVPPIYMMEAQPFTTPMPIKYKTYIDQYEKKENSAKEDERNREIRSLKEAIKRLQITKEGEGLEYEDLCVHPDIDLPTGYK